MIHLANSWYKIVKVFQIRFGRQNSHILPNNSLVHFGNFFQNIFSALSEMFLKLLTYFLVLQILVLVFI